MAEQGMFKTALRGFRKEDVLSYIDGIMAEHTVQEEALKEQVAELDRQLAEARVQQEAVKENEQLKAQVAELSEQVEALKVQVAEITAQCEQVQGAASGAEAREAELREQLEQSHQAVSGLWEEKAQLERRLEQTDELTRKLQAIGEDFCGKVKELLPDTAAQPTVETTKQMDRWLF